MHKAFLTEQAKQDIKNTLSKSRRLHGIEARKRYRKLISGAIKDLEEDVSRLGVKAWDEKYFRYHLKWSKQHSFVNGIPVKKPSDYIFFSVIGDEIAITRVLYDGMNFDDHM